MLSAAIVFWFLRFDDWEPFFNGQYFHVFYLYAFLLGVLASYIQYAVIRRNNKTRQTPSTTTELLGLSGLIFAVMFILWSGPLAAPQFIELYLSQFFVKCLACFVLILVIVNTPSTLFNKLIANPIFQSIGIIGFSFYLLHGFGISFYEHVAQHYFGIEPGSPRTWRGVLGSFLVTYPLALFTYSYIERPFFGRAHAPSVTATK